MSTNYYVKCSKCKLYVSAARRSAGIDYKKIYHADVPNLCTFLLEHNDCDELEFVDEHDVYNDAKYKEWPIDEEIEINNKVVEKPIEKLEVYYDSGQPFCKTDALIDKINELVNETNKLKQI